MGLHVNWFTDVLDTGSVQLYILTGSVGECCFSIVRVLQSS